MTAITDSGMFARDPEFPNLVVTRHPLLRHKVTLLRKRDRPKKIFEELDEDHNSKAKDFNQKPYYRMLMNILTAVMHEAIRTHSWSSTERQSRSASSVA